MIYVMTQVTLTPEQVRLKIIREIPLDPEISQIRDDLLDGVGFCSDDNKSFDFFSHEGDYLGTHPTYMVHTTIAKVKRSVPWKLKAGWFQSMLDRETLTLAWTGVL